MLNAGEVEQRKAELGSVSRSIDTLHGQIEDAEKETEKLSNILSEQAAKLEELHTEANELTRSMLRVQKSQERYLNKKQTLDSRKEECEVAIRDLGVLPDEAFTKYTGDRYKQTGGMEKLVKLLHKVNDGLKKFAHVNKKAFEQYNNFTKQRDELLARREELNASAVSIEDLIVTLDQRKDEAIERTFKQVSKYFEEVFEKLVPAGRGRLIMQKRADTYEVGLIMNHGLTNRTRRASAQLRRRRARLTTTLACRSRCRSTRRRTRGSVSNSCPVAKSLSWRSRLVSLTEVCLLIAVFAIQKCDPAPFYLFDEIDANLDPQYRTAVANMIHSLSDSAQFITTTFRSEMLVNADKCYGVYFDKQKVSTISTITKEEAGKFIDTAAGMT